MSEKQAQVKITIDLSDYQAHIFHITMNITGALKNQHLSLPLWTPGSYMVREFAQHIIDINAFEMGRQTTIKKINKNTFILNNTEEIITIKYQVYGFDSSIRAAFIDDQQAFFNGAALFLRPHHLETNSFQVNILPLMNKDWQVATAMPKIESDAKGFGSYGAASYEELIDYPFQISPMKRLSFKATNIPHEIVLVGDVRAFDEQRLTNDLSRLCATQIDFFGSAPFSTYLFIARFEEGGYGGLEHRNSTMLLSSPNSLPKSGMLEPDGPYRSFLALCSHEYFHSWNVKAIKPKEFVPYNLDQESYTKLLWVFEGITSYYDDLLVRRAGLISKESYLELMAKNLTRLKRNYGRQVQSVADASFDAWVKFYRPNENSPNATTSYYLKGSIIAWYLDLCIRLKSEGKKSLDDIMRQAYGLYGQGQGVSEEEWKFLLREEAPALNIEQFYQRFIDGLDEIPLEEILPEFGVTIKTDGDEMFVDEKTRMLAHLGCKFRFDDNQRAMLNFVEIASPAMDAGLSPGDEIVAINDIRLDANNWPDLAALIRPNDAISILYSRKRRMAKTELLPRHLSLSHYSLSFNDASFLAQKDRQREWLEG